MSNFFDLYSSFDDFYSTFQQGNEIEFQYKDKHYYILPLYDDQKNVVGVRLGRAYENAEAIYRSKSELYHAMLDNVMLAEILSKINIVWNNL